MLYSLSKHTDCKDFTTCLPYVNYFKIKKKKGSAMSSAYEQHTETETWLRTCTTSNDSHGDVLISGFFTPFAALFYTSLLLLLQEI